MEIFILKKQKNRHYDQVKMLQAVLTRQNLTIPQDSCFQNDFPMPQDSGFKQDFSMQKDPDIRQNQSIRHNLSIRQDLNLSGGCVQISEEPALFLCLCETKDFRAAVISKDNIGMAIKDSNAVIYEKHVNSLHQREQQYLSGLQPQSREWKEEYLRIAARKDAYKSYCGAGSSMSLRKFSCVDETLEPADTMFCPGRPAVHVIDLKYQKLVCCLCTQYPLTEEHIEFVPFSLEGTPVQSAAGSALDMLEQRNFSKNELTEKLIKKGYQRTEAEAAADEMESKGYTDDQDYAQRLVQLGLSSGKAPGRLRSELIKKGISSDIAAAALEQMTDETGYSEREAASAEAEKLMGSYEAPYSEKLLAKLGRKLASKGYSPSVIYFILDKYRS